MFRYFLVFSLLVLTSCSPDAAESQAENDKPKDTEYADKVQRTISLQETMFAVDDNDIVLGNPDANVTIIQYSSPTCPHCASYHKQVFPNLRANYVATGKIRYVIREFIANKQDLDAVLLAKCSGSAERFVTFLNVLYDRQNSWAFNKKYREILTNIGQLGGVSAEKYAQCLADKEMVRDVLNSSKLLSSRRDFEGTPVFYINGEKYKGAYSEEGLAAKLDELLAKNGA